MAPKCRTAPKAKGIKKFALKRPAARRQMTEEPINVTEEPFDLKAFTKQLWHDCGLIKKKNVPRLTVATSCSGVGTAIHVLNELIGKENVDEIFAVERDPAAVAFLLKNFNPGHVFQAGSGQAADSLN